MSDLRTYLQYLYGPHTGYVHLTVGRDPYLTDSGRYAHRTWEEHSFLYPAGLDDIIDLADEIGDTADVYHRPYVGRSTQRRKGTGYDDKLHSDIDGNLDPDRIHELGGTVIWSGGSPTNGYGIIPLTEVLDNPDHTALNKAYVRALGADSKFTDENVIRLPGTWNLKSTMRGEPAVQVVWDGRTPEPVDPAKLRAEFGVTTNAAQEWPATVQRHLDDRTTDRSTVTFRILAACHTAGMSFEQSCLPVMSRDDLRERLNKMRDGGVSDLLRSWVKITEAARADASFFGEPPSDTEPAAADATKDWLADAFTAAQLQNMEFGVLVQFIAGLITEGLGIIAGPPKLGKSWWVLCAALAVSSGGTAFNALKIGESRPVLLLALEDSPRRLHARIKSLWGDDPWPNNLTIKTAVEPGALGPIIHQYLRTNPGGLIVLDTLGRVRPPKRGKDTYAEDYAAGVELKTAIDAHPGSALLVVHHTRKAASDDFVDDLSGSLGLPGSADYVMVLRRPRGSAEGTLKVTSRDNAEGEFAFTVKDGYLWQLEGGTLAEAAKASAARKSSSGIREDSNTKKVLELVNAHVGPPMTAKEIGDAIGIGRTAITYLSRLEDKGLVTRITDKPADRWECAKPC